MDKERIKGKLMSKLIALPKQTTNPTGLRGKLDHWQVRLGESPELMNQVAPILNEICKEENLDLNREQMDELIAYLKPAITKFLGDRIKN